MYVGAGCAKVTSEDEGIVYSEVKVLDDRIWRLAGCVALCKSSDEYEAVRMMIIAYQYDELARDAHRDERR